MDQGKEVIIPTASSQDVTRLLAAWSDGDRSALDKLLTMVEDELHPLAHRYMSQERVDHTLQTTALVNEAYLKLIDRRVERWQNRAHFFGIAVQIMRRILIGHAHKHAGAKNGGGKEFPSTMWLYLATNGQRNWWPSMMH